MDETNPMLPYQMVLVYASSGCHFSELVTDLERMLYSNMTIIITGDFNFNKNKENALTRFLKENNYDQLINWPTHKEGRTIDHCYVSRNARV